MRNAGFAVGAVVTLALVFAGSGDTGTRAADPGPHGDVLARFLDARDESLDSYRGRRRLTAVNRRHGVSGWLEAAVSFDPSGGFQYDIVGEGGEGLIRHRVLRKVLAVEADLSARPQAHALTLDNYAFLEPSPTDEGLLRVGVVPRRREHLLVEGFIVLAPGNGDLVRIEGRLAKRPSFWTRRVDVVRRYGRVNGVRVPLETTSEAHVLLVGVSSLTMCYEYESINGLPADAATSCS